MTANLPPLIGLSGHAGSGKSTVADYLSQVQGYHQFAFADALKEVVGLAFGFSPEQLYGELKEVIDPRFGKSPRWCLQYLGTEVFRGIWPSIWTAALHRDLQQFWADNGPRPVVVTDVRLHNEAVMLKDLGAVLWRLERPGHAGAVNGIKGHVSETALDNYGAWDVVISSTAGVPQLLSQVDELLSQF